MNLVPRGYGFRNIYDKCGKLTFAVVQNRIVLIGSSPTFKKLAAIFLHAVLNPSNNSFAFHHSYVFLSASKSNNCGQNLMNCFALVREIPEIWWEEKGF